MVILSVRKRGLHNEYRKYRKKEGGKMQSVLSEDKHEMIAAASEFKIEWYF